MTDAETDVKASASHILSMLKQASACFDCVSLAIHGEA